MKTVLLPLRRCGYTLVEVLAAGAVIAVGTAAAVSLSSSLMLQEELAWRTAVTRNYQENMARVWQLGLNASGTGTGSVSAVMPIATDSVRLNEALGASPSVKTLTTAKVDEFGLMEGITLGASVNVSSTGTKVPGPEFPLRVYRPSLPASLRP